MRAIKICVPLCGEICIRPCPLVKSLDTSYLQIYMFLRQNYLVKFISSFKVYETQFSDTSSGTGPTNSSGTGPSSSAYNVTVPNKLSRLGEEHLSRGEVGTIQS